MARFGPQDGSTLGRCATRVDAIKAFSTGLGLPPEASSASAARWGPPRNDANGVAYEDRVSLSGEVRLRLDVTRGTDETSSEKGGDDPMHHRMSPEQRERIRELFVTDMSVRAEDSHAPAGEKPLRGLPTYELELGPDGRAYAVEPGVAFEPPKPREPELPPAPEVVAPPVPQREPPVERAEVEARGREPPERAPPEKEPIVDPDPARRRFAEAYRAAAEPPSAPSGSATPVEELG